MDKPQIITLDGPAGVGKTTLAQQLSEALNLPYLDSGAMFRLISVNLGEDALEMSGEHLQKSLAEFHFSLQGCGKNSKLYCNGMIAGKEIRTEAVASLAARLATLPEVRHALKNAQREIGGKISLVTEGRDMGTVIFPNALCKFFLDATPEERARRRCRQLEEMGMSANYSNILDQISSRDTQDRNRKESPLRPAHDAILIDTTDLTLPQVLEKLIDYARPIFKKNIFKKDKK